MPKRQRTLDVHSGNAAPLADSHHPQPGQPSVTDDAFINDQDAVDSAGDDDDEEDKPKTKAGRRKIKIEFIQDKSRRHITFSKRKAGIMKKAYELSTLTGTQVLLLVVSETGLVYTFTTAKLQPLVTQPEGKNLIQACLNAPHGSLPSSSHPAGAPLGRPGPISMPGPNSASSNLPGSLNINAPGSAGGILKDDEGEGDEDETHGHSGSSVNKRRRRTSSNAGPNSATSTVSRGGPTSPHSPAQSIPPALSIPPPNQQHQQHQTHPAQPQPPPQIALGSPTSPQQQHQQVPASPAQYSPGSYGHGGSHHQPQQHHPGDAQGMYAGHMMPPTYGYTGSPGAQGASGQQQLGGLAAAAAQQHGHWPSGPSVNQYARR